LGMLIRSIGEHARKVCGSNHVFHLTQTNVQVE